MTVSEMKVKASHIDPSEAITVTQNGKPVYVIVPYEQYIQDKEAIALVKILSRSSQDYREGRVMTGDELKEKLISGLIDPTDKGIPQDSICSKNE